METGKVKEIIRNAARQFGEFEEEYNRLLRIESKLMDRQAALSIQIIECRKAANLSSVAGEADRVLREHALALTKEHNAISETLGSPKTYNDRGESIAKE